MCDEVGMVEFTYIGDQISPSEEYKALVIARRIFVWNKYMECVKKVSCKMKGAVCMSYV